MKNFISLADLLVIISTFLLFIIALFSKGFTHDILLEAGVLAVSVKIIMMGYKNNQHIKTVLNELEDIKRILSKINDK